MICLGGPWHGRDVPFGDRRFLRVDEPPMRPATEVINPGDPAQAAYTQMVYEVREVDFGSQRLPANFWVAQSVEWYNRERLSPDWERVALHLLRNYQGPDPDRANFITAPPVDRGIMEEAIQATNWVQEGLLRLITTGQLVQELERRHGDELGPLLDLVQEVEVDLEAKGT